MAGAFFMPLPEFAIVGGPWVEVPAPERGLNCYENSSCLRRFYEGLMAKIRPIRCYPYGCSGVHGQENHCHCSLAIKAAAVGGKGIKSESTSFDRLQCSDSSRSPSTTKLIRFLQSGRSGLWSSERIKRARHSTTHHTAAMGIDHGSTDVAVT